MKRVMITCPPMQRSIDRYQTLLADHGIDVVCPEMVQELTEEELISMLPDFDGWVIGDDPATRRVFQAGSQGRLRAAVKWGVGVDNVDFDGAAACGLQVQNTPGMFGDEVADIAMGYTIALARQFHLIDRGVHAGQWPKPVGTSLKGKTVAIVGLGDVGCATARRMLVSGLDVIGYDPSTPACAETAAKIQVHDFPDRIEEADFILLCCSLNPSTRHLFNASRLAACKPGVRIINVSRGPLIDESALCDSLASGHVHSAALEVFEQEPLSDTSRLRSFEHCIFGSHNASNTREAVDRTSHMAISLLSQQFRGAAQV